jgi:hypothetical protein
MSDEPKPAARTAFDLAAGSSDFYRDPTYYEYEF